MSVVARMDTVETPKTTVEKVAGKVHVLLRLPIPPQTITEYPCADGRSYHARLNVNPYQKTKLVYKEVCTRNCGNLNLDPDTYQTGLKGSNSCNINHISDYLSLYRNYMYGRAGSYLNLDLLKQPDLVSTKSTISFKASLWLWMISSDCHTAIVSGRGFIKTFTSLDMAACDSPQDVSLRVNSYKYYCQLLGVDPGANLTCDITSISTGGGRKSKKLIPIFLGSIGGASLLCFLFFFFFRFRIRQLRRHKSGTGLGGACEIEPVIINFNYNYEVLQEATEGFYAANNLCCKQTWGTLKDGKEIAIKNLFVTQSTQAMEEFLIEIKIFSGFLHRNLIRLLGFCSKGQERFLVYEFMPNRSLDQHLFGEGGIHLKWIDRFKIITGTARGLLYLHEQSHFPIVHRDIKTPNILLDENLQPKIADFGLAKFFPEDKTHLTTRVVFGYTAPEYAVHGHLTQKADVYSYGVIVLEIVSGKKCSKTGLPHPRELLLQWILKVNSPQIYAQTRSKSWKRYFEMENIDKDNYKRVKIAASKLKSHDALCWENLLSTRKERESTNQAVAQDFEAP
ncbi:cysteine-rich receptor-like protein kinase 43 [Cryptomeria japonica]|uniref:cysteine-rich receptor-like protein kinase 43 n=1 Tax=Cryptomeria japonica TaxID=3369 RepID=UPI0027D9FDAF|nr:cysteine-rich receptor-like protein kinase 43 [Cryptomeria japonica]